MTKYFLLLHFVDFISRFWLRSVAALCSYWPVRWIGAVLCAGPQLDKVPQHFILTEETKPEKNPWNTDLFVHLQMLKKIKTALSMNSVVGRLNLRSWSIYLWKLKYWSTLLLYFFKNLNQKMLLIIFSFWKEAVYYVRQTEAISKYSYFWKHTKSLNNKINVSHYWNYMYSICMHQNIIVDIWTNNSNMFNCSRLKAILSKWLAVFLGPSCFLEPWAIITIISVLVQTERVQKVKIKQWGGGGDTVRRWSIS